MARGQSMEESVLRAAKEIVVKFIEVGRVSPASFAETFKSVYQAIHEAVAQEGESPPPDLQEG